MRVRPHALLVVMEPAPFPSTMPVLKRVRYTIRQPRQDQLLMLLLGVLTPFS
jgi:hypothetical protein